ncbi:MAG: hypothetical protein WD894_13865 [Pirellulales bacterium]
MNSVDRLIVDYRDGAAQTGTSIPQVANAGHDRLHSCFKQLRTTEVGRAAIEKLMADENPHVRLWAAAHSLTWASDRARPVLAELAKSAGPGSFDAEMTLKEFDKGNLSYNY